MLVDLRLREQKYGGNQTQQKSLGHNDVGQRQPMGKKACNEAAEWHAAPKCDDEDADDAATHPVSHQKLDE